MRLNPEYFDELEKAQKRIDECTGYWLHGGCGCSHKCDKEKQKECELLKNHAAIIQKNREKNIPMFID